MKQKSWSYTLKFMALICFLTVLALLFLLRLFNTPQFMSWYNRYTDTLLNFELWLETHGATPLSVLLILFNYALKAVIPWFPIPCICVASAVLFKWYYALIINMIGLGILFALKFYRGRNKGAGNAEKLLKKYDGLYRMIDESRYSSGVVLFFARLIPCFPLNSVSCVYGTTEMSLLKFLLISELGFLYRAITYIIIGRNVFDPASASFVVPFMPLIFFSGVVLLSFSTALSNKKEYKNNKEHLKKG